MKDKLTKHGKKYISANQKRIFVILALIFGLAVSIAVPVAVTIATFNSSNSTQLGVVK